MGPIPGESRDRPPNDDDHDLENTPGELTIPADLSASESDTDDDDNHGYMPLPQDSEEYDAFHSTDENTEDAAADDDDDNCNAPSSSESETTGHTRAPGTSLHSVNSTGRVPSYMQVPDLSRPSEEDMLWNQPRQDKGLHMDDERVAQVKAAMASFHLPESSVPNWARSVSDDAWKHQLLSRLQTDPGSAPRTVPPSLQSGQTVPCSEENLSEGNQ